MARFKVGDLVEVVRAVKGFERYLGVLGEIAGDKMDRLVSGPSGDTGWSSCYEVKLATGEVIYSTGEGLRLIPPKDDSRTVTSWASMPWKPEGVRA